MKPSSFSYFVGMSCIQGRGYDRFLPYSATPQASSPNLSYYTYDRHGPGLSPEEIARSSSIVPGPRFSKTMGPDFDVDLGKVVSEEQLPLEALDINNFVQEEDIEPVRAGQLSWRGSEFRRLADH